MTAAAAVQAAVGNPGDGWRYTARPEWSSAGESMWMRLAKFSLCNRLSVTALAALFAVDGESATHVDLRCADRWNEGALVSVLEIATDDVRASFCVGLSRPAPRGASAQLRTCPVCLERGYHAAWFQWQLVERCPLHGQPLRTGCVRCRAPIPYTLGHGLAAYPLSCANCGCAWVPGLARPAGRAAPLTGRDSRLLRRWGVYVRHVVADQGHRDPAQRDASLPACAPARPHPLTMINRLFDAPPPLAAQLLGRRSQQHHLSLSPAIFDAPAPVYHRSHWPHFDDRFALCQHVLHDARRQMFGAIHDECERGLWQHLVDAGPVAPADTIELDTAAALGWSMAWTSCGQTLAPGVGRPMPAFGLAGWLATLPLRPQEMPVQLWQSQVLHWLGEDLVRSAWVWRQIATFMGAKGFYLLHAALACPADLATLRSRDAETSVNFSSNIA